MPTFIGHAVTGIALSTIASPRRHWLRIALLCIFCSVIPDFDSIGLRLGIPYQHWLGHRGFSHSILFAAILGLAASLLILEIEKSPKIRLLYFSMFLACPLFHDALDAMTNGGLGVAFFSPFSEKRFFLPWRPIEVSPLSLRRLLTSRGIEVFTSECIWVIIPSLCFSGLVTWYRKRRTA